MGVIHQLIPHKIQPEDPKLKYFNAEICDGKQSVRTVSFNNKLRQEIEKAKQEKYLGSSKLSGEE